MKRSVWLTYFALLVGLWRARSVPLCPSAFITLLLDKTLCHCGWLTCQAWCAKDMLLARSNFCALITSAAEAAQLQALLNTPPRVPQFLRICGRICEDLANPIHLPHALCSFTRGPISLPQSEGTRSRDIKHRASCSPRTSSTSAKLWTSCGRPCLTCLMRSCRSWTCSSGAAVQRAFYCDLDRQSFSPVAGIGGVWARAPRGGGWISP
eukprot:1161480-Pelagomonas_calceolata.AAC.18